MLGYYTQWYFRKKRLKNRSSFHHSKEDNTMSKKMVMSVKRRSFEVDTSDEACGKFGFKSGDRIKHPLKGKGTVAGVAPANEGLVPEPDVLWCAFEEDKGRVGYCYANGSGASRITLV
jgi:hypothetical protein